MSQPSLPKSGGCRRCPFRAPSGQCLAPGLKSGRCGDWVWYLDGGKQQRRLYVKPRDPRTPTQRRCRTRFGAASRHYSQSLTQEQRQVCIAAGAKLRSRPRLAQSGPLTGQQYSIRQELAATPQPSPLRPAKARQGLQTKGISPSSSGLHRSITGVPPEHHRRHTGLAGRNLPLSPFIQLASHPVPQLAPCAGIDLRALLQLNFARLRARCPGRGGGHNGMVRGCTRGGIPGRHRAGGRRPGRSAGNCRW